MYGDSKKLWKVRDGWWWDNKKNMKGRVLKKLWKDREKKGVRKGYV